LGAIREQKTGIVRQLESEHVIGRASNCAVRIERRYVSAQHAILRWTGAHWELKDLGSRNGTFLNSVRLNASEPYALEKGAQIHFAKPEESWVFVDDSPAQVMATPLDGGEAVMLEGELLALPSAEEPLATIYKSGEGWMLENAHESSAPIRNLQTFEVRGRVWKFCCSDGVSATSIADYRREIEVRDLELSFSVSRDEEHVQIHVIWRDRTFNLGSRGHNYLLLTLARQRLKDAAEGFSEPTCGWIYQDDLVHDPSMEPPQLNISVFRIRRSFADIGVVDPANVIERRPRTRQIRLGTERIRIAVL
jgi:hypothetical protein